MRMKFRIAGAGFVIVLLAGLGGCSNGNGPALVRVFFGINGAGSCDSVRVDVSLSAADAAVATQSAGDPRCAIDAALAASGCDATFDVDGDILSATITGCQVPAVASLFECDFESIDVSLAAGMAEALCDCDGDPTCDLAPPVCASQSDDPGACEDCHNGIDDNADGDADCDDRNCEWDEGCRNLSTTTTSTTYTTNGTYPPPSATCTVYWEMTTAVEVATLSWDTRHIPEIGHFAGGCQTLVPDSTGSWVTSDLERTFTTRMTIPAGVTGPVDLSRCDYRAPQNRVPVSRLNIRNTVATDPEGRPVEPAPEIVVSSGGCVPDESSTTTTSSTTSTTAIPVPTTLEAPRVTFVLTSASSNVGALQFLVAYVDAPGVFQGTGQDVACENAVEDALFAANDDDAQASLELGFISLDGFAAPQTLAVCSFEGSGAAVLEPGAFSITIEDATGTDLLPITVTIEAQTEVEP